LRFGGDALADPADRSHAIRIKSDTAVLLVWTVSHAT